MSRLAERLPNGLLLGELEGKTTGGMAGAFKSAAKTAERGPIKDWLTEAYKALYSASTVRNDVLHARPATHAEGSQRLLRTEVLNGQATDRRFWIDERWFDFAISEINKGLADVSRVRPPFDQIAK